MNKRMFKPLILLFLFAAVCAMTVGLSTAAAKSYVCCKGRIGSCYYFGAWDANQSVCQMVPTHHPCWAPTVCP